MCFPAECIPGTALRVSECVELCVISVAHTIQPAVFILLSQLPLSLNALRVMYSGARIYTVLYPPGSRLHWLTSFLAFLHRMVVTSTVGPLLRILVLLPIHPSIETISRRVTHHTVSPPPIRGSHVHAACVDYGTG